MPDSSGRFKGIAVPRIPWRDGCRALTVSGLLCRNKPSAGFITCRRHRDRELLLRLAEDG